MWQLQVRVERSVLMQCIHIAFIDDWLVPFSSLLHGVWSLQTPCLPYSYSHNVQQLSSSQPVVLWDLEVYFSCLMACWDPLSSLPESWKEAFGVFGSQCYLVIPELQMGEHHTHRSVWEHRVHSFPGSPSPLFLSLSVPGNVERALLMEPLSPSHP